MLRNKGFARGAGLVALAVAATLTGCSKTAEQATPAAAQSTAPQHIFYVMMENHGYSQIIGNTADAPFINSLAAQYNIASQFHGVTHPSLPNYLAAISGDFQGIHDDCKAGAAITCAPQEFVPTADDKTSLALLTPAQTASSARAAHLFGGKNIVDQLEAKGHSWKAYMEGLPAVGSQAEYAPTVATAKGPTVVKLYAQKHNPFLYFSDINSPNNRRLNNIVPFESTFDADLANNTVPDFAWVSPNQCHDMHGISPAGTKLINNATCGYPDKGLDHGAIALGDDYLKTTITKIMSSQTWKSSASAIVISWDENDYSGSSAGPGSPVGVNNVALGGGDAPSIVITAKGNPSHATFDTPYDHYSMLGTIEKLWGLGCLANTCTLKDNELMTAMFNL